MNEEHKRAIHPALIHINGDVDLNSCNLDAAGHCITCSDEALPVKVLRIDSETGLALVEQKDTTEEIDITLVDNVVPGDVLLVHGGVAIGREDNGINDE